MAAVALAIGAGGALTPMERTVPLTVDETLDSAQGSASLIATSRDVTSPRAVTSVVAAVCVCGVSPLGHRVGPMAPP